jgi:hypothetical protein
VARLGHDPMSDLSPLSGEERKANLGAVRSVDDPSPTSPRPQALTEPLLPNKVSWIVARFGGAEGRRPPAKAAFNPARRLSEQLLRYPLNGVAAELRQAVAER